VSRASGRESSRTHETRALLLRRVDYGESDLILGLFTEKLGRVSALARGARRSMKRFGGSLESMHTLTIRCDDPVHGDLLMLREARIAVPRTTLASDLDRMQAAGRALSWVRRVAPPRIPEPEVWKELEKLLDRLSTRLDPRSPSLHLASTGLTLLAAFGWGLELGHCVRCGRPCPPSAPALLDATHGGLVCRACGGGRTRIEAGVRARLAHAASGIDDALEEADSELALDLVEQAMRAHAGFD
jgi:DNA repair protein RecO (recombination protein O)